MFWRPVTQNDFIAGNTGVQIVSVNAEVPNPLLCPYSSLHSNLDRLDDFKNDGDIPAGNPQDKSGHAPDRMMEPGLKLDFDSFFATNPELIKRGIGLQPAASHDFQFNASKRP